MSPKHPVGERARDEPEATVRTNLESVIQKPHGVRAARGRFTYGLAASDPAARTGHSDPDQNTVEVCSLPWTGLGDRI